jgi:hypothetical protein
MEAHQHLYYYAQYSPKAEKVKQKSAFGWDSQGTSYPLRSIPYGTGKDKVYDG